MQRISDWKSRYFELGYIQLQVGSAEWCERPVQVMGPAQRTPTPGGNYKCSQGDSCTHCDPTHQTAKHLTCWSQLPRQAQTRDPPEQKTAWRRRCPSDGATEGAAFPAAQPPAPAAAGPAARGAAQLAGPTAASPPQRLRGWQQAVPARQELQQHGQQSNAVSHSHAISPQADRQRSLAVLAAVRSSPLRPDVRLYSGTFGSVRPCREHSAAPTRGTATTGAHQGCTACISTPLGRPTLSSTTVLWHRAEAWRAWQHGTPAC